MTTRTASDIAAKAAENVTSISAKRSSGKKTAKGGRSDHPLAPDAFGDKDTIHDFDREDTATEVIRETQSLSLMETFELPSNPKAALIADEFVWIALQNGWAEVRDRATGTLIAGCRTRPDQQRQPSSAAIITCMFHDDSGGKVWIGSSDGTLQAWKRDGSARVGDPFQAHHGAVRCVTGRDVLWTAGDDW